MSCRLAVSRKRFWLPIGPEKGLLRPGGIDRNRCGRAIQKRSQLSARSRLILLYALCGFANLGSLGIMIAGLVAMAPERREEIVSLGPRTIVSGTLATLLTGAIVGAMTPG